MTDPDTPQPPARTSMLIGRWPAVAAAICALVLAIFFTGYYLDWVYFPRYSANQWAAAGGWVSGVGTLAAVGVALWQSGAARRDAKLLLAAELDAQRRSEQLASLVGIWSEVDAIRRPYDAFWEELVEVDENVANPYEAPSALKVVADTTGIEVKMSIIRANVAFEPALLRIVEPNTQEMVTAFYQDYLTVMDFILDMVDSARAGESPTYDTLKEGDRILRDLQRHKKPFLNVTREYLTQASPLPRVANVDKVGHPYGRNVRIVVPVVEDIEGDD